MRPRCAAAAIRDAESAGLPQQYLEDAIRTQAELGHLQGRAVARTMFIHRGASSDTYNEP